MCIELKIICSNSWCLKPILNFSYHFCGIFNRPEEIYSRISIGFDIVNFNIYFILLTQMIWRIYNSEVIQELDKQWNALWIFFLWSLGIRYNVESLCCVMLLPRFKLLTLCTMFWYNRFFFFCMIWNVRLGVH